MTGEPDLEDVIEPIRVSSPPPIVSRLGTAHALASLLAARVGFCGILHGPAVDAGVTGPRSLRITGPTPGLLDPEPRTSDRYDPVQLTFPAPVAPGRSGEGFEIPRERSTLESAPDGDAESGDTLSETPGGPSSADESDGQTMDEVVDTVTADRQKAGRTADPSTETGSPRAASPDPASGGLESPSTGPGGPRVARSASGFPDRSPPAIDHGDDPRGDSPTTVDRSAAPESDPYSDTMSETDRETVSDTDTDTLSETDRKAVSDPETLGEGDPEPAPATSHPVQPGETRRVADARPSQPPRSSSGVDSWEGDWGQDGTKLEDLVTRRHGKEPESTVYHRSIGSTLPDLEYSPGIPTPDPAGSESLDGDRRDTTVPGDLSEPRSRPAERSGSDDQSVRTADVAAQEGPSVGTDHRSRTRAVAERDQSVGPVGDPARGQPEGDSTGTQDGPPRFPRLAGSAAPDPAPVEPTDLTYGTTAPGSRDSQPTHSQVSKRESSSSTSRVPPDTAPDSEVVTSVDDDGHPPELEEGAGDTHLEHESRARRASARTGQESHSQREERDQHRKQAAGEPHRSRARSETVVGRDTVSSRATAGTHSEPMAERDESPLQVPTPVDRRVASQASGGVTGSSDDGLIDTVLGTDLGDRSTRTPLPGETTVRQHGPELTFVRDILNRPKGTRGQGSVERSTATSAGESIPAPAEQTPNQTAPLPDEPVDFDAEQPPDIAIEGEELPGADTEDRLIEADETVGVEPSSDSTAGEHSRQSSRRARGSGTTASDRARSSMTVSTPDLVHRRKRANRRSRRARQRRSRKRRRAGQRHRETVEEGRSPGDTEAGATFEDSSDEPASKELLPPLDEDTFDGELESSDLEPLEGGGEEPELSPFDPEFVTLAVDTTGSTPTTSLANTTEKLKHSEESTTKEMPSLSVQKPAIDQGEHTERTEQPETLRERIERANRRAESADSEPRSGREPASREPSNDPAIQPSMPTDRSAPADTQESQLPTDPRERDSFRDFTFDRPAPSVDATGTRTSRDITYRDWEQPEDEHDSEEPSRTTVLDEFDRADVREVLEEETDDFGRSTTVDVVAERLQRELKRRKRIDRERRGL